MHSYQVHVVLLIVYQGRKEVHETKNTYSFFISEIPFQNSTGKFGKSRL